ncbi:hypothetical protein BESB_008000 [Besnoitia besnoiti]|uniref:Uncharacterized protein n=1 Tax=Besnoitia besnoiti TaxID=94643 RepID=A0A2A9MIU1_BESBE|nr:hypothetical protein BESB_008000 [Besnoitia besnoiti]PFH38458.1 hypothetical protein BESB_008000 [Besnoitia besnoiti]
MAYAARHLSRLPLPSAAARPTAGARILPGEALRRLQGGASPLCASFSFSRSFASSSLSSAPVSESPRLPRAGLQNSQPVFLSTVRGCGSRSSRGCCGALRALSSPLSAFASSRVLGSLSSAAQPGAAASLALSSLSSVRAARASAFVSSSNASPLRAFSSAGADGTPEGASPPASSSAGAASAASRAGEKARFLEFCEVASGVPLTSPAVTPGQKEWIFSPEEERGVKSPGGFLGLVFAFNQKFSRLKDLGFFVLLSCKQGARQALVLLSEELVAGIQEERDLVQMLADREKQKVEKGEDDERKVAAAPAAELLGGTGGNASAEEPADLEKRIAGAESTEAKKADGNEAEEDYHGMGALLSKGRGLENLKTCVSEPLLTGLQLKVGEAVDAGCRLTFDVNSLQKVYITRMWTVCGTSADPHAAVVPRSSYLVPITPFLHAVLPQSANSSFFLTSQYMRACGGLLLKGNPAASLVKKGDDADFSDAEDERGGDKGDKKQDEGEGKRDREEERGAGFSGDFGSAAAGANKAPLSFPERMRKVMERLELLEEALGKGIAVVMEAQVLCRQRFAVHDKNRKLLFGSEDEEQVIHTLRFQLTARKDGKQWGIPTFQPSSWTLVDWNGLVGSEYPCDVSALRNVVVLEKNEELPKGKKLCYD